MAPPSSFDGSPAPSLVIEYQLSVMTSVVCTLSRHPEAALQWACTVTYGTGSTVWQQARQRPVGNCTKCQCMRPNACAMTGETRAWTRSEFGPQPVAKEISESGRRTACVNATSAVHSNSLSLRTLRSSADHTDGCNWMAAFRFRSAAPVSGCAGDIWQWMRRPAHRTSMHLMQH